MKILIIHTAFIGDIVLSTPLIQKLKDLYPKSKIDYLTLPTNQSVLYNNPNLNEIILYDKKGKDKGIKGFLKVLKILKQKKYDYAVIPHRFIKSILLAKLAKIPDIVGFDVATGSSLLDKKVHYDMKKHEVERLLNLVGYEGKRIPVRIYPAKENFVKIEKILKNSGYTGKKEQKLILVAPGSQRPEKMWPIEKYREVIQKLKKNENYFIGITGSKSEKELPLNFEKDKNVIDFRGEISLVEFGALISKADVVVGNDSSPIHIASGFEKPFVIGIFGPGKRSLGFFPWTEKSNVIEDNEFYENNIVIIPKNQHKYKKDYYKGIPLISTDRVYEEIITRI
ncbi:glycosyltransferase family 9 protein [Leptotrichia buccalis]|uniref:Glycosyl transferase family 9 n=1 Tax=Leptotrichia buccalis (strain ATCC 14201 / DSM 1135 / JCM 12969 / NCTC 10249 / C-1013-b) TaxID=523794 RepID=C7NDZ6_LEPBD|nr:glycosyltransferase family 9 protein [Leptotrichia buccalis]ACV40110.1 glycosyl transferase family 9 [Leptotrichia buccalis C-1013-b]